MVNYSKFFSDVALARKPSPIRVLTAIQAAAGPEMISLAGGQPNPLLFPINAVSFDIGKSNKISFATLLDKIYKFQIAKNIFSL